VLVSGSAATSWKCVVAHLPKNAMKFVYGTSYPRDSLSSVSCPSAGGACVAIGSYTDTGSSQQGLILSGAAPSVIPLPAGGTFLASFGPTGAVSCGAKTACTILSSYVDASDAEQGMVVTGSGTAWSMAEAPLSLPPNASDTNPEVQLSAVSCAFATGCAGVGSFVDGEGASHALELQGGGSSWISQEAELPVPNDGQSRLVGVSCVHTVCVAVGNYQTSASGDDEGLLERLS
jgi:hypothetical protein